MQAEEQDIPRAVGAVPPTFTSEQVIALAPDPASASAGRGLSGPSKWVTLGIRGDALWGECQGSGKTPYQTRIDLTEPAFKCSCPSRKFPCKHGLGLMLLWVDKPALVKDAEPPAWVAEWLASRTERAVKKQERAEEKAQKEADPVAQAKRAERRESRVEAGVAELEVWLRDVLRRGFAAAKSDDSESWHRMAARLVDAQAPGLSRHVRTLQEALSSGDGWQSRALRQAARIHMLTQAWRRIETLPEGLREDVRAAIGFTQSKEEVLAGKAVADDWYCWAQDIADTEEGVRAQRLWMVGLKTRRVALLLSFARPGTPFEFNFAPGMAHAASLAFYPSATPLRALVKERGEAKQHRAPALDATLAAALGRHGEALARNPFVEYGAFAMRDVRLALAGERFLLVDGVGRAVPAFGDTEALWRAYSATMGRPAMVFAEWDEQRARPLAVEADGVHYAVRAVEQP